MSSCHHCNYHVSPPKGRDLGLFCPLMSPQHLKQFLAVVTQGMNGPSSLLLLVPHHALCHVTWALLTEELDLTAPFPWISASLVTCFAQQKRAGKMMPHSESEPQKALHVSIYSLTLHSHHVKDIPRRACLSHNNREIWGQRQASLAIPNESIKIRETDKQLTPRHPSESRQASRNPNWPRDLWAKLMLLVWSHQVSG